MSRPIEVAEFVQTLTLLGYDFRLNEAGDTVECNGKPLDPITLAQVRARMRAESFNSADAVKDVILMQAGLNRYHPIRQYLATAGIGWDGSRHIQTLSYYFEDVTQPHKLFSTWLRKWLIGAVAKATDGEHHQNAMLVIDGPQGIGKSHFVQWLCSPIPDYFVEGGINPENKDCWVRLMSNFVWEVGELGATTKRADIEALKQFISTKRVSVRKPYGEVDTVKPALASLIGTVNEMAGILSDQSGNRRFLVSTIKAIDWNYTTDVDINQVWGEAFVAYQRGEPWQPTPEELKLSEENNQGYQTPNPLEGILDAAFEINLEKIDAPSWWTPTNRLVSVVQSRGYRGGTSRGIAMEIAATLKAMGLTKEKRRQPLAVIRDEHGKQKIDEAGNPMMRVGNCPVWGYGGVKERDVCDNATQDH